MFAATLLFCLHTAAALPQCGALTDQIGPYETENACMTRVTEMQKELDAFLRLQGFQGNAEGRMICRKLVKGARI